MYGLSSECEGRDPPSSPGAGLNIYTVLSIVTLFPILSCALTLLFNSIYCTFNMMVVLSRKRKPIYLVSKHGNIKEKRFLMYIMYIIVN